ncbi:Sugar efflux transporter B [Mycobacterium marinum]|uniref:Sugar efflux transporter B n=1 Tax=Mycobacterium marinum TaxID=1781 RepID=A0A3E2N069_MYCMR|nr:MFS transporter [Mycobacterium marinum]RFZ13428.1 Sugar efflux transporter B [Mycobacterium marinum]RFZ45415.1 Sugar efflux transporter B [Mycobacterium marinum]
MPESVTAPPELGIRHATPGLLALTIATCLAITTEILPVGLLPAIGHTFGVRDAVTGLLVSLYAVLVALLAVPLTVVTARFPRKPLLLTTLLGYAVSNTLVAVAPTFAMVAAGRAVGGVTHALFFSLCIGYAPRLVGLADVGRALALVGGGVSAGIVVGVPLLTSVGTAVGWRGAFAVLAVLAAVLLLAVAKLLPPVSSESAPPPAGTGKGRRRLAAVVSSNALTYTGQFTLYTFISAVLLAAGARPAFIGPLLLMCGVCSLAGLWYVGATLDRNPRQTTVIIIVVVIGALLGLGASFPALLPVVLAAAVWNGAFGGIPSIYQAGAVRAQAATPEMAGAWVNATANLGIAGGAAIGAGLLPTIGLAGLPWVAAALIAISLAVTLATGRGPTH